METHRMCHPRRPRRPRAAVRRPWWAVVIPCLLAFWLTVPAASGAEPAPAAANGDAGAAEVEFVDVLFTPTPLPGTDVSLAYGFARTRERDEEIGSIHRHDHEVSLGLSYQISEWVGIGVGIPYSITDVRTTDPATGDPIEPDTRNLGDITLTPQVTFYKNPAWRFAIGGAVELGLPTGSASDGTGGLWSVKPSLIVGQWLGPVQLLADVGFGWELRRLTEEDERGQELTYNVAVAYPQLDRRLIPFLELNGAYVLRGDSALRHRGQLYVSPGVRIFPFGGAETAEGASEATRKSEPPWWHDLSLAVGMQFPVTASRTFEWGIRAALKVGF